MVKNRLKIQKLNLWFGEKQILKDISFSIPDKKITAIIGPSGCGKTTFLRCFNRMNDTAENVKIKGKIILDGYDIYEEKIVRMYPSSSISRIGGDSSIDTLSQVIDDETHEVAEYAVNGIAEMGSQRGGDILMDALRSDYDKVRYYAVIGLKKIKYKQATDILRYKAEHDSNETIRKEAEKALEEIIGN